ncbi:CoA transferase [Sphingomonas sp. ST-64]|uniref:CoA transferase n=1 Tax=Sphingomonas plantiphila TaxID=3163295 RepID=A0ABW8YQF4_9SPHN
MSGPLAGVRVLEIGHYIAGPHAAQMMGDQGAEVIKVEPLSGDPSRKSLQVGQVDDSMLFACHNRGKRSVAVDLRSPDAPLVLDPLLGWADVVITNYTRGVPEKLGFGFEHLSALNPRAVMVHVTGYDMRGPWADYAAFDGSIIAMSGIAEMTGSEDGPPLLSQILFADHSVGAHAAFAAAVALAERERTGRGRLIEMNMLDVMTTYLGHQISMIGLWNLDPTRSATRAGTRFVHLFPTREGSLFVAAITIGMWRGFAQFVGHPEWAPPGMIDVPDFLNDDALKTAAIAAGQQRFDHMTAHEAMDALQRLGVTCGVMRSARQLFDEEQAKGSGAIHRVHYPDGTEVPVPGPAIEAGHAPASHVRSLGSDSADVLGELGVDAELVAELVRRRVIAVPEIDPARTGWVEPVPAHLRHRIAI